MDELMGMVGLNGIKQSALNLWTDVQLAARRPTAANAALNHHFIFQGSPGTGKTVVAKLMAQVLKELGVRDKATFESRTGGELLRDGADDFKSLLQRVDGGVLFIDEVYQLSPKTDTTGRDILNLLLTFAEDKRATASVILAGYRDEVDELIAFNPGLASRFPTVWVFADYNERELYSIFCKMVADRQLQTDQSQPPIGKVVAARLARGSGKPGFGNARAVRNVIDTAVKRLSERLAPRVLEDDGAPAGGSDGGGSNA